MNEPLVVALIQNAGLLLAMIVVFDVLSSRRDVLATRARKVMAGVAIGLIGIAMIDVSVPFASGIIFDTRSVLLSVAGLFLGVVPSAIAVALTAAFRLVLGGPAALTGVYVIVASGAIGVLWRHLRAPRRPPERVSALELYALGLVVHAVMLAIMFTLPHEMAMRIATQVGAALMIVHPLATVATGLLFVQRLRFYRTAAELADSESRFRLLAEQARDVIFRYEFKPRPAFTYVSPSSTAFTGYRPEEYYADPDLGRKLVHPNDRPLLEAARRGELQRDEPLVLRWIRKDGEILWTEQRNTYLLDEDGEIAAVEGIVRDITGSKQADAMIRTALKATNQGLYDLNVQTGVITVSDEYARLLGYDAADFRETLDAWIERTHPADVDRVRTALDDYLNGRTSEFRTELRQRTRRGDWLWFLSLGSIVSWNAEGKPQRIIGTHTDITPLKSAEQQTRDAQREMARLLADTEESRRALLSLVEDQQAAERQLLEVERELRRLTGILEASQAAARVGGWDLDLATQTLFWTAETYRIHDVSPEAYSPSLETARAFFTPDSVALLDEVLRDAIDESVERGVELELNTIAGRRKWVYFASSVIADAGRTVRVTCAIQDITERKLAERERLTLTAQLHQAQKLESLGSLAGGVAHDMNNVLAAILSSAEAHRRTLADDDPLARALDTIANACVRGRSVVRSLLYFARMEIEARGAIDLNAIVRDIVDLLDKTTLKKIRFTTTLEEHLPRVQGDLAALSHALMNLCVNAVDAMPSGGELAITTRTADGLVEIVVRDTGIGMTRDVLARAIEPFFTTKPVGKGTGLGLAMVYGTVKAHGGTIDIESEPGKGTEVRLGFQPMQGEVQDGTDAIAPPPRPGGASALRILLVDDDELIRAGVAALLEADGHEVHAADGGHEALTRIQAGLDPDVVILDVNMPGLTGPETLVRILALRPSQPVIMSSGYGEEEMARAVSRGPNVVAIPKPFTLDELEAKLTELGVKTSTG